MNSARILIVEDDAVLATHLDEMLNQMGYQVTGLAATGEKAIQSALEQSPDVILMDIRLRGKMNGIQATEEIHKSTDIPVVYLTAYTEEPLLQQAKLTDAYGYLAKPVRGHELRASLEMALYKHQSEKQILHLNRVLRAVRNVNQLITRERDPQRLMEEACNILVRTRDYKLAWIGQTVGDRLKPIASAGEGKDVIDLIFTTASEKQTEKLPGMESLRTQQPVVSHNIPSDDRYAPWREKMEQRKLFSRAAIPMITGDRHLGVLSVYSEYATIFDEAETSLLMELAGDLAFGLSSIEEELERKRAEEALRESESRFRTFIEQAPIAISVSRSGHGLYANQKFLQLVGLQSIEESVGRPILEYFAPQARDESKERSRRRSLGLPVPTEFESTILHIDGSQSPVQIAIAQVHLSDGVANIAFVTDITERKMAEKRIKRQIEQLTALNEIDRMITSSFNLQLNLTSIIDRVISQQKVDAADILLMNPDLNILEFGAGHGFRTLGIEKGHLSLGEGYAGRAALERQTIHISDLRTQTDNLTIQKKLANDSFVSYYAVPLVAKGKVKGVLEIFNRSPLNPDFEWLDFLNTLAGQAAIAIDNATLFGNLQRSNTELAMAYDATIEGWSRALDMRDKETEGHSLRVTEMASMLASKFGIQDQELVQIRWGALLHDIGKMGVPDGILLKPDALTEQEWELMKSHPILAYKLLSPIGFLRSAVDIPYCHHEKWDGSGYPRGLKGEQIPLSARIFAVIDVWDALTSDRIYRKAWSDEKALEYIRSQSGIHFDPKVVKVCLESGILERRKPK